MNEIILKPKHIPTSNQSGQKWQWAGLYLLIGFHLAVAAMFFTSNDGLMLNLFSFGLIALLFAVIAPVMAYQPHSKSGDGSVDEHKKSSSILPMFITTFISFVSVVEFQYIASSYELPNIVSSQQITVNRIDVVEGVLGNTYQLQTDSGNYVLNNDWVNEGDILSLELRESIDGRVSREYICFNDKCTNNIRP
jgi:hypothetical protein